MSANSYKLRTKLKGIVCLPDLTRTLRMQAFLRRSRITILGQKFRSARPYLDFSPLCRTNIAYLVGQRPPDLLRRLHWLEEIIIVRRVAFLPAPLLYFSRQSSVFLRVTKRQQCCHSIALCSSRATNTYYTVNSFWPCSLLICVLLTFFLSTFGTGLTLSMKAKSRFLRLTP